MSHIIKQKLQQAKAASEESIPAFLKKTYEILEDGNYSHIICWSEDGCSLIIKDPTELCQKVLPQYFKHNNLTSFVRQLNMYDFHKKKNPIYEHIFAHELFQKGKKELLKDIKRKNSETVPTSNKTKSNENEQTKNDMCSVMNENFCLKKLQNDMIDRLRYLESRLSQANSQNQNLWNYIYKMREQETSYKNLLGRLVDLYGLESVKSLLASIEKETKKNLVAAKAATMFPNHFPELDSSKNIFQTQIMPTLQPLLNLHSAAKDFPVKEIDNSSLYNSTSQILNSEFYKALMNQKNKEHSIPSVHDIKEKIPVVMKSANPSENDYSSFKANFENLDQSVCNPHYNYSYQNLFDSVPKTSKHDHENEGFVDPKLIGKRKRFDKQQLSAREIHVNNKGENGDSYYQRVNKLQKNATSVDSDASTNDERVKSFKTDDAMYEEDDDPNLKRNKSNNFDDGGNRDFDYNNLINFEINCKTDEMN